MANPNHLAAVQAGRESLLKWRRQNSGVVLDLVRAKLSKADLRGCDLAYANLQGANLSDAQLQNANLHCADLREANLRRANLSDAKMRQCTLEYADIRNAVFNDADLTDADIGMANAWGVSFRKATLAGVNLLGAVFDVADFRYADLQRANLGLTDLRKAKLWKANLSEANLEKTRFGFWGRLKLRLNRPAPPRSDKDHIDRGYDRWIANRKRDLGNAEQRLANNPSAENYLNRAQARQSRRQFHLAIEDYAQVLGLSPECVEALVGRAKCYRELEEYEKSLQDYDAAICRASKTASYYFDRAKCRIEYCDTCELSDDHRIRAVEDFTECIRLSDRFSEAHLDRGLELLELKEHDLAIADFRECLSKGGDKALVLLSLGEAYLEKGQFNDAIAALTESIEMDPECDIAYALRERSFEAKGDLASAAKDRDKKRDLQLKTD